MKLAITRPREDALPLSRILAARGHQSVVAPLLEIVPRAGVIWPDKQFQAVCVTSANGLRSLSGPINPKLPIFAVGTQSAVAARDRGFEHVTAEGGDVHGLVKNIARTARPADGPILYISGSETSGDLQGQLQKSGFSVTRLVTYNAVPQKLDDVASELRTCDGVLLYSPRSAKLWIQEMKRLGFGSLLQHMMHYCLSLQVTGNLPSLVPKKTAESPNEATLLALLEFKGKAE